MPSSDSARLARACYKAYETGDRQALENLIADDFAFWSPQDDGIDRTTYFERCWPNNETLAVFDLKRLYELGDEVIVTYEAERKDGSRFRNTEVLTFAGDQLKWSRSTSAGTCSAHTPAPRANGSDPTPVRLCNDVTAPGAAVSDERRNALPLASRIESSSRLGGMWILATSRARSMRK